MLEPSVPVRGIDQMPRAKDDTDPPIVVYTTGGVDMRQEQTQAKPATSSNNNNNNNALLYLGLAVVAIFLLGRKD